MVIPGLDAVAKTNSAAKAAESVDLKSRIPTSMLGQDEFLQLLVTQLANQDPLSPQTDTAFIGQMAQFTTLEQTKDMTKDLAQIRSQQKLLQAMSLLDREVVVQSGKSGIAQGVIKGFEMDGQNPKLIIGSERYNLDDILTIRLANQIST